jgi:hypothetical protein
MNQLVKKVRQCSIAIRSDPFLRASICELQKQHNLDELPLVNDEGNNWNSTFLMIRRYIKVHYQVLIVLNDQKFDDIRLNEEDLSVLKDFEELISNFNDLITVFSSEKNSCCSYIIPGFKTLLDYTKSFEAKSGLAKHLQGNLIKTIEFCIAKYEIFENEDLMLFTFLDPRFKAFPMFPANLKDGFQSRAIKRAKEMFVSIEGEPSDEYSQPPAKRPIFELFGIQTSRPRCEKANKSCFKKLITDINKYTIDNSSCPVSTLAYWKFSEYKCLGKLARVVLSCLPVSTPSEWSFLDSSCQKWYQG